MTIHFINFELIFSIGISLGASLFGANSETFFDQSINMNISTLFLHDQHQVRHCSKIQRNNLDLVFEQIAFKIYLFFFSKEGEDK